MVASPNVQHHPGARSATPPHLRRGVPRLASSPPDSEPALSLSKGGVARRAPGWLFRSPPQPECLFPLTARWRVHHCLCMRFGNRGWGAHALRPIHPDEKRLDVCATHDSVWFSRLTTKDPSLCPAPVSTFRARSTRTFRAYAGAPASHYASCRRSNSSVGVDQLTVSLSVTLRLKAEDPEPALPVTVRV